MVKLALFSVLYYSNKSLNQFYYKKANYDINEIGFQALNNNIASSYILLGDYKKAIIYLKKNLDNDNFKTNKWKNTGVTNSLLGHYYLKIKKPKLSYHFLKKAENIFKSRKTLDGENYNQIYLSEYYYKAKDTLNSIKAAQRAVNLSKNYNNPTDELFSLSQLINVDKKNASINAQEYIRINDSLQVAERSFRDKFANIAQNQESNAIFKTKMAFFRSIGSCYTDYCSSINNYKTTFKTKGVAIPAITTTSQ